MMISIIIPTFNRPALLQRAVASALAACPGDGEVIVVDDKSDTAVKALRDVLDHPRLRILTNTGDKGAAGARNHGTAQALGGIVMFLDDDDVMVADYPKRVLAAAQDADWGFAQPARAAVAATNMPTGLIAQSVPLLDRLPAFKDGFWIKRQVSHAIGPIRTDLAVDADSDLCLRLYGHNHPAWFDALPACVEHHSPTAEIDQQVVSHCHLQTFQRNQAYFGTRSPERWALIQRCLQFAADNRIAETPKTLLATLTPLDWRIRAWLFWQRRKHSTRTIAA